MTSPSHVLSPRAALLALAVSLIANAAAVRSADACSPRPPSVEPIRPRLGELAVATNAKIWISAPEVETVTLRGNNEVIEADVVRVGDLHAYVATPRAQLLPGLTYTVTATSPQVTTPQSWHFTTGSGPSQERPGAPPSLKVFAVLSEEPIGSCGPPAGTYIVDVSAAEVSGAALYQLEVLGAGGFQPLAISLSPKFVQETAQLPSPTYRIRPIAMNGSVGEEEALPSGNVRETSGDGEAGGCAAGGDLGGSAPFAFVVVAASAAARRRRSAARR